MHLKRSNSNLSLRPRRSFTDVSSPATLQHQDEEETTDQQRLLSKEEATVLSGFDDWDDGDGDPDHQGHYRQTDMRSVWRFIMIGACIGFGFLIFKVVVLKYGHSAESMKHHHGVEQLFDNGTALFGPTLILVSLDGFRNDYLQRGVTPHLAKLGRICFPFVFYTFCFLYIDSHACIALFIPV
ncbi:hypothetical protein BCR43DRAFT_487439 [Syncephalastrum racemosum]|uniref:Uncharacterized protein n=1 Tax=Syncephalastrum racemosum TaxID=13706 RepID=A0A1X2HQZ5_SYNRA|nr:hypothetical protein BCR43DRAFT_487439 [Syncephalastrum racemosum]